jgi:hypothetical protein
MTLTTEGLSVTFSITKLSISKLCHYAERSYAECRILFIVMLKVNTLSVVMLSVTLLNVVVLSVVAPKERLIKN